MGTDSYTTTLEQYEKAARTAALREYGCTGREYDDAYPAGVRSAEWIADVLSAAQRGDIIAPRVLDYLAESAPGVFRQIYRHHVTSIPAGYLQPVARRANQQHEADMRAARRNLTTRA